MNMVILFLVRKIRSQRSHILRIILSAATGALLACIFALITFRIPLVSLLLEYGLTSALMILVAFGAKGRRESIHNYITFILSSFLLGGLIQSISSTYKTSSTFGRLFEGFPRQKNGFWNLMILSFVLTPLIFYLYNVLSKNKKVLKHLYEVEVFLSDGKCVICKGLMDTGNSLTDPIKGWPVIIADSDLFQEELLKIQKDNPASFCVIPYSSIGKEHGLLYGFRISQIIISNSKEKLCTKNVVVALASTGFCNKSDYRMLLHSDLLSLETK